MTDATQKPDHEWIDDGKLQQLFDGELTEGEERVVRRDVSKEPLEKERLARLERRGDLVRFSADDASANIDADALFAKIEAGVAADKSPRLELIKGQKKQRTMGIAVTAFAVAAAVAIAFFVGPGLVGTGGGEQARHPMDDPREVLVEHDPAVLVHPPSGSEVEHVDFGANTGTVFEVQGEEGQPLAVVWIAEDTP